MNEPRHFIMALGAIAAGIILFYVGLARFRSYRGRFLANPADQMNKDMWSFVIGGASATTPVAAFAAMYAGAALVALGTFMAWIFR